MNFVKKNIQNIKGTQPTKWDKLLPEFVEPGDTLYFDPEEVKRPAASQCAKRMMVLDPSRRFHSGFDVLLKQTFVRARPDGEVPDKEEEDPIKASLADFDEEEVNDDNNNDEGNSENDARRNNPLFSVEFE